MALLADLRSGLHGLTLVPPDGWELEADGEANASFVDREAGVGWYFFFFPKLRLDLREETFATLERDVGAHAICLLESMHRGQSVPVSDRARTVVLLSCERTTVGGGEALSILHRMVYTPGREILMGHLLVPLRDGVFEARFLVLSRQTGLRESVLLAKAMAGQLESPTIPDVRVEPAGTTPGGMALGLVQASAQGSTVDPEKLMASIDYDAERYDDLFPTNVVTVARRTMRWLRDEAGIRVSAPGAPPDRELVLRELRCAFTPPPRFALWRCTPDEAELVRVSLAGNDGVQQLFVMRGATSSLDARVRETIHALGAREVQISIAERVAPLSTCIVADGAADGQLLRMIGVAWDGWLALLATTQSQEPIAMIAELAALAQSLRPHTRPWWRVW